MTQSIIGILAGMGPKSTGPFIDQVVTEYQLMTGVKNDIDFPPLMIYSLPTPFYLDRPLDHDLMEKTICKGLKKLESTGVCFIAMPCNTAHLYFDTLQKCISIPLLNIVEETLSNLPTQAKKVAIVGTRATLASQIYQRGLSKKEVECAFHEKWQQKIDEIISLIKSNHISHAIALWEKLSKDFATDKVDTILVGCTDLNVILDHMKTSFRVVDSSNCLAKAVTRKWIQKNG